jgi:hypothetical protein
MNRGLSYPPLDLDTVPNPLVLSMISATVYAISCSCGPNGPYPERLEDIQRLGLELAGLAERAIALRS